jgi:hypothetical protein
MELLQKEGAFFPPLLSSLEEVHAFGIGMGRGNVYADTWDLQLFSICDLCFEKRKERMEKMNLEQTVLPFIDCSCKVKQD